MAVPRLQETFVKKEKKNKCLSLKRGKLECCGKLCIGEYCNKHISLIRNGSKIPLPFLVCGIGVANVYFICFGCGLENKKRQYYLSLAKIFEN